MLHWIYPHVCEQCGESTECSPQRHSLCESCLASLERIPSPICQYCGSSIDSLGEIQPHCPRCKMLSRGFNFARHAMQYNEDSIRLVEELKFRHKSHLAQALAPLLSELWDRHPQLRAQKDWTLIPVPISRSRLQTRHYNQSEELARALQKLRPELQIGAQILKRREHQLHAQSLLNAHQRHKHARLIFALNEHAKRDWARLSPNLLLIDDIYTTGATATACARALRQIPHIKCIGSLNLLRMS